jgi:hypothetical protein
MQLNNRLKRRERRTGAVGRCPLCGGQGQGRFVLSVKGVDLEPATPPGCPGCGKGHVSKRIVMDGVGDAGLRVLRHLAQGPVRAA